MSDINDMFASLPAVDGCESCVYGLKQLGTDVIACSLHNDTGCPGCDDFSYSEPFMMTATTSSANPDDVMRVVQWQPPPAPVKGVKARNPCPSCGAEDYTGKNCYECEAIRSRRTIGALNTMIANLNAQLLEALKAPLVTAGPDQGGIIVENQNLRDEVKRLRKKLRILGDLAELPPNPKRPKEISKKKAWIDAKTIWVGLPDSGTRWQVRCGTNSAGEQP